MAQIGLDPDDANPRVELLETPGNAHEGARGAHGGHQQVDPGLGLFPDLLGGSVIVGLPVGLVVELIRQPVLGGFLAHQVVGVLDGAIGAEVGRREMDVGSQGPEDADALLADCLRHGQQDAVALHGRHQCQADPGVAAGRLQNHLVRGELTRFFRFLDHPERGPVLDRAAGVEALHFGEDFQLTVGVQTFQGNEGRPADLVQNVATLRVHESRLPPEIRGTGMHSKTV